MQPTRSRSVVALLTIVLTAMLVTGGLAGPMVAASAAASPESTASTSAESAPSLESPSASSAVATQDARPENPSTEDTVGYVEGYWYDDELAVDSQSNAVVDEDELDPVIYRAMARVETIRNMTFEDEVAVDVVSRETYRQTNEERFANYTAAERLEQNVGYEALFTVDRETAAADATETVYGGAVKGYYDPETDEIVIVSENPESPELDELTLGHELVHALQDQRFDLSRLNGSTQDAELAGNGLAEGDASWVERAYEDRCGSEWDCLSPSGGEQAGNFDVNWGIYFAVYQPYSDGPDYVDSLREQGEGWSAVNAAYDDPPATTSAVIHPGSEREPANVSVPDRSSDGWRQLTVDGAVANDTVGEAGMVAMFAADAMDGGQSSVISATELFGSEEGSYNYDHSYTDGWAGDKLVVYTSDEIDNESDPAAAGEAGYVWRTKWQSTDDTEEFLDGYRQLLDDHGAEAVDDRQNTFVIDDGGYSGAYFLERNGTTVTIVRAPSVAALSNVETGAAPEAASLPIPGFGTTAAAGAIAITLLGSVTWLAVGRYRP
ncbi:Hvo_1808 family surface protein [Natrinema zhouii]|uniref:PGF-CTERM sorting domain-containing protein n=1 Tax=Natrinema zhouii TaxID=1710539 RepID=A0A7D6CMP0_9EURY|nr:Hvo_1808 family surface protein [Natrinema zhouii]QLK25092.1 Hvo_1808 family surface protein [Natrinema zhouii]